MPVVIRVYTSPTLVLLAYDWPEGDRRADFLGFAIQRRPGFNGEQVSWLPNRIGFDGPKPDQSDFQSNQAPIQKFYWWDARIDTNDRGQTFSYTVIPVTGKKTALVLDNAEAKEVTVMIPQVTEHGITTHFNRAVVSSQAFSQRFPELKTDADQKAARAWLANGLEQAVPQFLGAAAGKDIEGAIYHLTDDSWILPALQHYGGSVSLVYHDTGNDHVSQPAIQKLIDSGRPQSNFTPRTHANIMHDKFLVRVGSADHAEAVLLGSANFTPEGLSVQANVLHAFESPSLAACYLQRKRLLNGNPALADTQKSQTGWSQPLTVGDARVRAFFPPERKDDRISLDTIITAIQKAQHSVLLCAYDPTDEALLNAAFAAGDKGRMMLALVNRVPKTAPTGDPSRSDVAASIAIYNRSTEVGDVQGFASFRAGDSPTGFAPERILWPKENPKIMVRIHHKFVVIDAEGDNPIVYTGSANFSNNALHKNDENLIEITQCPRIAAMYLAEFLRLYEHYRARIAYERHQSGATKPFKLTDDNSWSTKFFVAGSPEMKARQSMAGTA